MIEFVFPPMAKDRGVGYWLRAANLWAARRKMLRLDFSNEWRYSFGFPEPLDRSVPFSALLPPEQSDPNDLRFIILGDTGEGDRSQYATLPLIRTLQPDFMIINGDIAYPAGRINERDRNRDDYLCVFFEPYRDLNCPIWAVPGNHEYYPDHNGREFHEIFCTRKYAKRWEEDYGLRLVPQPGTFWELSEPDTTNGLVVIGLDTGKTANLDGTHHWWQVWKRREEPDHRQHDWLTERLELAARERHRVIIMFHIPGLVCAEHEASTHLTEIHRIIARYDCVRLVVSAHEHSFQSYEPQVFRRYLEEKHKPAILAAQSPHYFVSGRGGAYLSATDFGTGRYPTSIRHPSGEQYRELATVARRAVDALGLAKTLPGMAVARIEKSAIGGLADDDAVKCLSLILVEVRNFRRLNTQIVVTPVFLDDLEELFADLPPGTPVNVQSAPAPIDKVRRCLQPPLIL